MSVREGRKIFFTADEHYGHANVIKYCRRPWADVRFMDSELARRAEEKIAGTPGVDPSFHDVIVYHVGDYSFTRDRRMWSGFARHIYILGNHDRKPDCDALSLVVRYRGVTFFLAHSVDTARELGAFAGKADVVVVGHVHNLWKYTAIDGKLVVNVGVDEWGYEPAHVDEVISLWKQWKAGRKVAR